MKRLFIISLIISIPVLLNAQAFNIGVRGGLNSNKYIINTENFTAGDAEYGFAGGVFLRFKIPGVSIQPEMIYSQKNGFYSYSSLQSGLDTLFRNRIQYFDFPILLNFHLGKHIRIGTGPVISVHAKEIIDFQQSGQEYVISIDKKVFKDNSYSWQFAAALEFNHFFFDVRYEYGVDKINYAVVLPSGSVTLDPDIKISLWQFTLGYKFRGYK